MGEEAHPVRHKVVVHTPLSHADIVRQAIGEAGGGQVGNYSFCSFSVRGIGRFKPGIGAVPHVGTVGQLESVEEECIEVVNDATLTDAIIAAIRKVHPYEEPAIEVYRLENL